VAEFALPCPAQDLAPRLIFALAADHFLMTRFHFGIVMRVELLMLRLRRLPHPPREIARRVYRGLGQVRKAGAKRLHAVRLSAVLCRDDLDHLVCLLQMPTAKRLTRMALLRPVIRLPVSRESQAKLLERPPRLLDLCREPAPGFQLRVRPHESAVECSSDFDS